MPFNPKDTKEDSAHPERIQYNLTYATLMLTLGGRSLQHLVTADRDPKNDLRDVHQDITAIVHHNTPAITWEWYEEGFRTPDDHDEIDADGLHTSYVTHHNGPQYFGYINNNPTLAVHLHDLKAFLPTFISIACRYPAALSMLREGNEISWACSRPIRS